MPLERMTCPHCGAPSDREAQPPVTARASLPAERSRPAPSQKRSAATTAVLAATGRIWNPLIVTVVSVVLGFLFGGILIALNWHALRKHFRAILVWIFTGLYVLYIQSALLELVKWPWPYLVGLIVWFPPFGLTQYLYLKREFNCGAPSRRWLLPISLGIALNAAFLILDAYEAKSSEGVQSTAATFPSAVPQQQLNTPDQIVETIGPFVTEVETRWKESYLLLFSQHKGMTGSAVLIRSDTTGFYLVTNRHVVEPPADSSNYSCTLRVGTDSSVAEVIAYAKNGIDLALLRVRAEKSPSSFVMPMLALKDVAVGQPCVAIGNALGAGTSVTTGVVSRIDDFGNQRKIRTSAPISPGNSGGGLFSLNGGYLIGITTEGLRDEGAQNINFAIPIDYFAGDNVWDFFPGTSR